MKLSEAFWHYCFQYFLFIINFTENNDLLCLPRGSTTVFFWKSSHRFRRVIGSVWPFVQKVISEVKHWTLRILCGPVRFFHSKLVPPCVSGPPLMCTHVRTAPIKLGVRTSPESLGLVTYSTAPLTQLHTMILPPPELGTVQLRFSCKPPNPDSSIQVEKRDATPLHWISGRWG